MTTEIKIAALCNAIRYKDNHFNCPMPLLEIVAAFEAYLSGDNTLAVSLMGALQEKATAKRKETDTNQHQFVL